MLTSFSPYILYIKLAVAALVLGAVSFSSYKITMWKATSDNAAKTATFVAKIATLQSELDKKQFSLDLYAANTEMILTQQTENEKQLQIAKKELARKQSNIAKLPRTSCDDAITKLQEMQ